MRLMIEYSQSPEAETLRERKVTGLSEDFKLTLPKLDLTGLGSLEKSSKAYYTQQWSTTSTHENLQAEAVYHSAKYSFEASNSMESAAQGGGGNDRWLATDITNALSNGLLIPDAAFIFANTKTGKLLSNGGAHAYQSMPRAQQIAAVRELQFAGKLAKPLTRGIAVVNVISTTTAATDDFVHGRYKSGSARLAVWGVAAGAAFIPVVGWGLSIGIGVADAIWGDDFYNYVEKNW